MGLKENQIKQYKAVVVIHAVVYEEHEDNSLYNPQPPIKKTYAVVGDTLESCQQRLTQFLERLNNENNQEDSRG